MSQTKAELIKGLNINASAPATALNIDSSGRVGIGTTSPVGKLDIAGTLGTVSVNTNGDQIEYNYNGFNYITVPGANAALQIQSNGAAGRLIFGTAGSERLRITSAGLVGIGTSTPSAQLHVVNATLIDPSLTYNSSAGQIFRNELTELAFGTATSSPYSAWIQARFNGNIAQNISLNPLGGRVGIGTTGPNTVLDVFRASATDVYITTGNSIASWLTGVAAGGDYNIYSNNASNIRFTTNASERARIDSSGRLLVGTSTSLSVGGDQATVQVESTSNSIQAVRHGGTTAANGSALVLGRSRGTTSGSTTAVASGDVLGYLAFAGANGSNLNNYGGWITCEVDGTVSGGGANDMPGRLVFSTTADGASSPTERMRIGNNGFTTFTTTSTLCTTRHRNDGATAGQYWNVGPDTGNTFIVYNQSSTGVYITNGGTSWTANSDERLKTGLEPITEAAQKVSSLRAVTGRYITDDETVSRAFLIAQDVQAVLPEAVNVQQDSGGTLGLQYTDVIPLLVAAIKEQQETIADLKARVAALESA